MGYTENTNVKDGVTAPPKELEAVLRPLTRPLTTARCLKRMIIRTGREVVSCYVSQMFELGNEDGKRKAFSFLENSNRCCMAICFSNFEVGPKMKG